MTTPPTADLSTALSPYFSIRQAVRPAIFAYSLLAREQDQAEVLVAEASNLLQATQELLQATGLYHILSAGSGQQMPADNYDRDWQTRIAAAYSSAGMKWARIIGGCLALGEALAAEGRSDDARHLASCLKEIDEANAAKEILRHVSKIEEETARARHKVEGETVWAKYSEQISRINDKMPAKEIENAIYALTAVLTEKPDSFSIEDRIEPIIDRLALSIVDYHNRIAKATDRQADQHQIYDTVGYGPIGYRCTSSYSGYLIGIDRIEIEIPWKRQLLDQGADTVINSLTGVFDNALKYARKWEKHYLEPLLNRENEPFEGEPPG